MITITVTALDGQFLSQPAIADFGEAGGSIGRQDDNTLVLPDPERFISRVHAIVEFRAGQYLIRDEGTAIPVYVNFEAVGNGREKILADDDEIRIGGYVLSVAIRAPVAAHGIDPFDDPLGGSSQPSSPPRNSYAPPPVGTTAQREVEDPFAAFAAIPRGSARPNFGAGTPASSNEHDPFADFMPAPDFSGNSPLSGEADYGSDLLGRAQSIDALFGLGGSDNGSPFGTDSFGSAGQEKSNLDPLAAFGAAPSVSKSDFKYTQRDDTPELQGSMQLPQARPAANAGAPKPTSPPHPPSTANTPTPQPRPAASSAPRDELLQALLNGAGLPDLRIAGGLTPQLMNAIGKMLRESTQGTLDLLQARAITKREIRAGSTIMVSEDNNPLKFSPNVEIALSHLLSPPEQGFTAPLSSIKGAYDDLRSHQIGFMAGMQAALKGILARFNPERLGKRLQQKTMLDSLLPMHRRAKLWDLFGEMYGDISKEAEDDFHALFGKEFLRAYEQQIIKLQREDRINGVRLD